MDHPIIAPKRVSSKEAVNLFQRIRNALRFDDKNEFLRLVRDPEFEQEWPGYNQAGDFNFLTKIYEYDALEVGIAVFNGETKGIIDHEAEHVLYQGITQLHIAAAFCSPKLTKYFLERGDNVDVLCDFQSMNMKQATPLGLALESIHTGFSSRYTAGTPGPWSTHKSILELLVYLCSNNNKRRLETVRLLVQNTSNRERVKQAFIDYANNGQLVQLSALFMAVPDLFFSYNVSLQGALPPIGILYLELNSLEKRTDIEEALLLLLDVFTIIGDKLVAFTRLEDYNYVVLQERIIAFLLDEVAHKKPGVSSPDDYYLRFFKPVRPEADQLADNSNRTVYYNIVLDPTALLSFYLKRKDITIHYINRMFRSKSPKYGEAALLYKTIDNKLSSMSTFHRLFKETIGKIPMKEEKYLPQWFPFVCSITFKPNVLSFPTAATRAKPWISHKFTPRVCLENKAMQQTKLTSFLSFAKLSRIPMIIKRLIK